MNNLTFDKLYNFLEEVDEDFPIPLSHKTNLHELSKNLLIKQIYLLSIVKITKLVV